MDCLLLCLIVASLCKPGNHFPAWTILVEIFLSQSSLTQTAFFVFTVATCGPHFLFSPWTLVFIQNFLSTVDASSLGNLENVSLATDCEHSVLFFVSIQNFVSLLNIWPGKTQTEEKTQNKENQHQSCQQDWSMHRPQN